MESSLSLEETNKLRLSLGLKPIVDDARRTSDAAPVAIARPVPRDAQAERDAQALQTKKSLQGPTLGDVEAGELSTAEWLARQKRKKAREEKRGQATEESPGLASDAQPASLKVAHRLEDLEDGDHILTLKDQDILNDDESQLISTDLAEARATEKRLELKKKRPGYNHEEGEGVLPKYNDQDEEEGFVLGPNLKVPKREKTSLRKLDALDSGRIELVEDRQAGPSDYMTYEEAGIKKPKRKKKISARQKEATEGDDEPPSTGLPPAAPSRPRVDLSTTNLIDDDDLGRALAMQRRAKAKVKKLSPEEIAQRLAAERTSASEEMEMGETGGLVIDDTSEFIRKLETEVKTEREAEAVRPLTTIDTPLPGNLHNSVKKEESPEAMAIDLADERRRSPSPELGTAGEIVQSRGLSATLSLLRQQGRLPAASGEQKAREEQQKEHQNWLADKKLQEHLRQLQLAKQKGQHRDHAQWEFEKRVREQEDIQDALKRYQNYKPDVKIAYYDDFGRELNVKEAWKALSHKFHGRNSGKAKEEKRLQRIEEQRLAELAANRSGIGDAFERAQQQSGNAHVVLSRGAKNTVPTDLQLDLLRASKGTDSSTPKPTTK